MKKRKLLILSILVLSFISISTINAGYSGIKSTYTFTSGVWKRISGFEYLTSSSAPTGSNTYTKFHYWGSLEDNYYKANSYRTMKVELWESDPVFNPDEFIKIYIIGFTGNAMTSVTLSSSSTAYSDGTLRTLGLLEGDGDFEAEYYLYAYLDKIVGDSNYATDLFYYSIEN